MGLSAFDERAPILDAVVVDDSNTPGPSDLVAAPIRALRVDAILAGSTSAIDHDVLLQMSIDGVLAFLGVVTIPATAGHAAGVPAVDLLAALPASLAAGILVNPNCVLGFDVLVVLDTGELLTFLVVGGEF